MSSEIRVNELPNSPEIFSHARNPSSTATIASGEYSLVPLALLDEPEHAARETMDEDQLAELAESIRQHGLIQPLVVERNGERYRVVAGHRRLLACQIVEWSPVPCLVRDASEVDPVAVMLAENYYREPTNPAEESVFLDRLLEERCGGDVDLLAALVRRRRQYVEDRLLLRRGDPRVFDALAKREIPLGVARELNRVKDDGQRLLYLDSAIRGGATATVVHGWRVQGDNPEQDPVAAQNMADAIAARTAAAAAEPMTCLFCGDQDEPHLMQIHYLHSQCKKFLGRILDHGPVRAEPRSKPGFGGILPPSTTGDDGF